MPLRMLLARTLMSEDPPIPPKLYRVAPTPVRTCIQRVTSFKPAQLDHCAQPVSRSFTNTPLMVTKVFSESYPRMRKRAEPKLKPATAVNTSRDDWRIPDMS